jgi:hypothetical protein
MSSNNEKQSAVDFAERVRVNQRKLEVRYKVAVRLHRLRLRRLGNDAPPSQALVRTLAGPLVLFQVRRALRGHASPHLRSNGPHESIDFACECSHNYGWPLASY